MLEVDGITVRYGELTAVDRLTLSAADGEVLGLLGPSGCGKSTVLRAIAGLVPLAGGRIRLDGRSADGLRPDQRGIGLMFQDHVLFPHRNVGENVAFGPRMRGLPRADIQRRVAEALELVRFPGTEARQVTQLSGGEQQRVALARAIASRPRLLMLDEPLGSLDRALRDELLQELPEVFARLGTTVVYVTHDQHEALAVCDRIAVMRAGRLEQVGPPETVWTEPATAFVARFIGLTHHLDVEVVDGVAASDFGPLRVSGGDGPATLVLRSDALRLLGDERPRSHEATTQGRIVSRRFAGDHARVEVEVAGGRRSLVAVLGWSQGRIGDDVVVALDERAIHRLPPGPDAAGPRAPA